MIEDREDRDVDEATARPWGLRPSKSSDPMQRGDIAITTADPPRADYLGIIGEVWAERRKGEPDAIQAQADAALIVEAVNAYDRLRTVESAAGDAFVRLFPASEGGPSYEDDRLYQRLGAALGLFAPSSEVPSDAR